jgi:O-antigen ligase
MQSVTFGRFLAPVLVKLGFIAAASIALGFAVSLTAGLIMSSSLLALYVAGFVFALYRTLRWMEASQGTLTLEAPVGEWNTIGSSLYRARKLERAVRQDLDRSVEQLRL